MEYIEKILYPYKCFLPFYFIICLFSSTPSSTNPYQRGVDENMYTFLQKIRSKIHTNNEQEDQYSNLIENLKLKYNCLNNQISIILEVRNFIEKEYIPEMPLLSTLDQSENSFLSSVLKETLNQIKDLKSNQESIGAAINEYLNRTGLSKVFTSLDNFRATVILMKRQKILNDALDDVLRLCQQIGDGPALAECEKSGLFVSKPIGL